ncbi:MAG TPA: RNA 2',3'-cyclic phosphodiesterase [Actinomycetota bacterium]|jgi:2'-5' RNA ligase
MRLFVAVEVPEQQKRSVERAIQSLRMALVGAVRWVPRENWHATLKFLGEVPDGRLPDVSDVLAAAAAGSSPTTTSLTGVGAFPSLNRARVLWVGLDDPEARLASMSAALETAFGEAGFRQESRALHPHVTLARIRAPIPIAGIVEKAGPYAFDREPFAVTKIVLYQSRLSRAGATYEPVATFPLA